MEIIIASLIGLIASIASPNLWKWQQHRHQLKIKTIDEFNEIYHIYLKTTYFLIHQLNDTFRIATDFDVQTLKTTWKMREKPTPVNLQELWKDHSEKTMEALIALKTSYLQLISDEKLKNRLARRSELLLQMRSECYQICHFPKDPYIEQKLTALGIIENEYRKNETTIFNAYMKTFTKVYRIKNCFTRKNNNP